LNINNESGGIDRIWPDPFIEDNHCVSRFRLRLAHWGVRKMKDEGKAKEQLINEMTEMRQRIAALEAAQTERKRAEEMHS
jgi:hypothetical protein